MHALFGPALPAQYITDLPIDEARAGEMDRILSERRDIAAVIVEPMLQGAAGMRMHGADTLRRIREVCDRHGVLLIFDEIFTGLGRLGAMTAAHLSGVTPDIMTLGKALTGGVTPLAATIASAHVYSAFHADEGSKALMHGPTYTGHALACAAANASLDLFASEPRLAQVAALDVHYQQALAPLRDHPGVADVRIRGSVAAVEMAASFDLQAARRSFIEQGVFIRPIGKTVYLAPAYTISGAELVALTDAVLRFVEHSGIRTGGR
jgi:adenosylmethionine-8-amino-7-oxononanoate aminotransferase